MLNFAAMKKDHLQLLVCVLLTVYLNASAHGESWKSFGKDTTGQEVFYDQDSLARVSPTIYEAWFKFSFPPGASGTIAQKVGPNGYMLNFIQFRNDRRYRRLRLEAYNANGVCVSSVDSRDEGWMPISPGNAVELLWKVTFSK